MKYLFLNPPSNANVSAIFRALAPTGNAKALKKSRGTIMYLHNLNPGLRGVQDKCAYVLFHYLSLDFLCLYSQK